MARRSYGQYCGLAKALDVLGERWTLLIVRDLLIGPLRYGDLFSGLDGISTDLLADRLRNLQEYEIVEQVKLAPPAASTVYQLTERGRELAPLVAQLAAFGGPLLDPIADTDMEVNAGWALTSMVSKFSGEADFDAVFQLDLDDRSFTIRIDGGKAGLNRGPYAEPDVLVSGPALAILGLLVGDRSLDDASIAVTGERRLVESLVQGLGHPTASD